MFTIVAERINCTRKTIREATEARDVAFIQDEAAKQAAAGATYIDVNAGSHPDTELANMQWLLEQVQTATQLPICLDSANPRVVQAGLAALDGRQAMINSILLDDEKLDTLLPLVQEYQTNVIALCMSHEGMPNTAAERLTIAGKLLEKTRAAGINDDRVYIDPLVRVVSAEPEQGAEFLYAIRRIREAYPSVHFCAGISNVSFGLPLRSVLNRTFVSLAIWEGLDGAILDPLDKGVMSQLYATRALTGQDEFCMEYVTAAREGLLA
ncbi:MAG TPA: dihydropteroate synthase [Armatimonadota bacterium]|nr:dihydropteroate synthase [Armatimonadota bacterium]